jgi:hypothetical protein
MKQDCWSTAMNRAALTLLLIFMVGASGCATKGKSSYRAFQQQEEADLVVDFWHWDSWEIEKPAVTTGGHLAVLTKRQLLDRLDQLQPRREFVVVILDKRSSPEGKGASLDELESFFQELGFHRVVIQLAVSYENADGLPILRDSKAKP